MSGTLSGKQIRKRFRDLDKAEAERAELERQRIESESSLKTVATTLSHDQCLEAQAAFRLLQGLSQLARDGTSRKDLLEIADLGVGSCFVGK